MALQGRVEAVPRPALDSTIRVHNVRCSACSVRKDDRAALLAGAQARPTGTLHSGNGDDPDVTRPARQGAMAAYGSTDQFGRPADGNPAQPSPTGGASRCGVLEGSTP